jgi:multiple sugar transport system substrate-binding protein
MDVEEAYKELVEETKKLHEKYWSDK